MTSQLPKGKYVGAGYRKTVSGYTFERYLLMLFGLKGLQKGYEYSLATESEDAGKFDDVVFYYIREDSPCTRLVRAKHFTGRKSEITAEDLLDKKPNSKFGLKMYFESYLNLRGKFSRELELILCTNIGLKFEQNSSIPKLLRRKKTNIQQHEYLYFEP